jgi:uncharacterized protein YjeT (DUF2065 family)
MKTLLIILGLLAGVKGILLMVKPELMENIFRKYVAFMERQIPHFFIWGIVSLAVGALLILFNL